MKNLYNFNALLFICALFTSGMIYSQQSYTFTSAGAIGSLGPTQAQLNTAYLSTNLNGLVTTTNGIQNFTVPQSGLYRIQALGASGGNVSGFSGYGAKVIGDVSLVAGSVLDILVGQMGSSNAPSNSDGGGGGSFVNLGSTLLFAGGGGGGGAQISNSNQNASLTNTVISSSPAQFGSAAAGYSLNGTNFTYNVYTSVAQSFLNGGAGQAGGQAPGWPGGSFGDGGFGGGGSSCSCSTGEGGGGGGFVGGGGGSGGFYPSGIGGSSYIIGSAINFSTTQLSSFGNGTVIITSLCNINITSSGSNSVNPVICAGNSVTLSTNAISGYSWSTGSTASSIVVSPAVTTNYSLTATSSLACVSSAVITVSVNSSVPTLTVVNTSTASGATGVCAGKSATLTASGAITYTWTGGVTNAVSFTPAATSGYTVLGTNACGTRSAVTSVSVITLPIIGGSANNPTICSGNSIILTGSGGISYTWSPSATNGVAFIPPFSNNYTVTGTGSAGGCTNTAVVGVTVYISPTVPPIASPTAICIGSSSTLSALGATGYTWTAPSGPALTGSVVTVSPSSSTTYTLSRLNSTCPSTSTLTLVVNNLPIVFASGSPTLVCSGSSVSLNAVGAITYSWYPGGPFPGSNVVLYPISSTNYTVVASNGNCTNSAVVPISTNPNPTINIVPSTTLLCQGGSNTVTLTASGAQSYTWQTSPNLFTPVVSVSPLIPTLYTVIGSNSFNCTSSQQQLVLVTASPSLAVASSASYICTSGSAVLTAYDLALPGTPGTGAVNYLWNTGASTPSIGVSPSISTNYTVTGTYVGTGCQTTTVVILPVYIATFAVTGSSTVCQGSTVNIQASGAAANYLWNTGATTGSISVSPAVNTTYSVTGSTGLCFSTQTVGVIVNPLPLIGVTVAKQTICKFEQSVITATGATSYSWAGVPNPVTTPVLTYSAGQNGYSNSTQVFTVTGTDVNGCSKSAVVTQLVATCIGIENLTETETNQLISVWPNPNHGEFSITSAVAMQVKMINNLGQVVKTLNLTETTKQEINMTNLANGIYLIIGESQGKRITKKIVLNR